MTHTAKTLTCIEAIEALKKWMRDAKNIARGQGSVPASVSVSGIEFIMPQLEKCANCHDALVDLLIRALPYVEEGEVFGKTSGNPLTKEINAQIELAGREV